MNQIRNLIAVVGLLFAMIVSAAITVAYTRNQEAAGELTHDHGQAAPAGADHHAATRQPQSDGAQPPPKPAEHVPPGEPTPAQLEASRLQLEASRAQLEASRQALQAAEPASPGTAPSPAAMPAPPAAPKAQTQAQPKAVDGHAHKH